MKKVWIWNHYATNTFFDRGGRHYAFAKYLSKQGYAPTVFCASTVHNAQHQIQTGDSLYSSDKVDNIPYFFIKTSPYKGNGFSRVKNMLVFARNVKKVALQLSKTDKPDVILASSVHPFTVVAGILTAKKLKVPCIAEIRDLWPESIVEYTRYSKNNPIIKALYRLEKWIYQKADRLIFLKEGDLDYIREKGWEKSIDSSKIFYINNGVDLAAFEANALSFPLDDQDLTDTETFKAVYTGSIRAVNNIKPLVEAAAIIEKQTEKKIRFLIYGAGEDLEPLKEYALNNGINNVVFKGNVDKKYIPYILRCSDLNLLHVKQTNIMRFGSSMNKEFDYYAAGMPIFSDFPTGYNLIKKYNCGVVIDSQAPEAIAEAILQMASLQKDEYEKYCENAKKAAKDYDYKVLAEKLMRVIEGVTAQ